MQPFDIACRRCASQPKECCKAFCGDALSDFHAERIEDAAAMTTSVGNEPTVAQLDKAIDESGLV